jgi:phosphatidylethanolamine/phosphatidyl-N-methylethanolamine N-methyltransferase
MVRLRPTDAASLNEAAYERWAPIYDFLFDLPFHPGRRAAANAANAAAGRNGSILVIGVGTGLELPLLSRSARVTGVDLSEPMLAVARRRVEKEALGHVRALHAMDAGAMSFADASFDVTLAPYVVSVVPQPETVLSEMWRVTRPGGQMIVMNHFADEMKSPRAAVEAAMQKFAGWLGWHPRFQFATVGDWIVSQGDATLVERRDIAPFDLFTLLRIEKAR